MAVGGGLKSKRFKFSIVSVKSNPYLGDIMAIARIDKHLCGGKNNKGISSRGYPNLASIYTFRAVYPCRQCGVPRLDSGVVPNALEVHSSEDSFHSTKIGISRVMLLKMKNKRK